MTIRNTILKQLLTDLNSLADNTTTSGTVYTTDIKTIRRGVYGADSINAYPAVCYTAIDPDTVVSDFGGSMLRKLPVYMYGYVATKTYKTDSDAYDGLHNLVGDLEYFLYNDFAYSDDTQINDVTIHEAGLAYPIGWFELNFTVTYGYQYNNN